MEAVLFIACKAVEHVEEAIAPALEEFRSKYSVKLAAEPVIEVKEDGSVIVLVVDCRDKVEAEFLGHKFESILKRHDLYG